MKYNGETLYNLGCYPIYLTGSEKTVRRCVYWSETTDKGYIKWYGNLIEVAHGVSKYYTVEPY